MKHAPARWVVEVEHLGHRDRPQRFDCVTDAIGWFIGAAALGHRLVKVTGNGVDKTNSFLCAVRAMEELEDLV